jgi:hypothetical protein
MRLTTLYLTSALTVAAAPLLAAQPPAMSPPGDAGAEQTTPTACKRPGWVWEPAGYLTHGIWRPAHCAPREPFT